MAHGKHFRISGTSLNIKRNKLTVIIKKQVLYFTFLLLFSFILNTSKAQGKNQLEVMMNNALIEILDFHSEFYNSHFENKTIENTLYIFEDSFQNNFEFSKKVTSTGIKFVSICKLSKEQIKEGVLGISYTGLVLDGKKLELIFVLKSVRMNGKVIETGLSEGYSFEYIYSCEKNKWEFCKSNVPK